MGSKQLTQRDLDDLSAWLDRELTGDAADRVAHKLRTDPTWQAELDRLKAVNEALDRWTVPAAPEGLAERIIQRSRQQRPAGPRVLVLARWLVPPAAAAAVLLIGLWLGPIGHRTTTTPGEDLSAGGPTPPTAVDAPSAEAVDELVAENLDFFQKYDIVSNMDLLEEIARQDRMDRGS